jgi:hypothetical protein
MNYESYVTRAILLKFYQMTVIPTREIRIKVASFVSILLLHLFEYVVCVGYESGRRKIWQQGSDRSVASVITP